jgi:hypothetical protein
MFIYFLVSERAQKQAEKQKTAKSQLGARAAGLKISCPTCKVSNLLHR